MSFNLVERKVCFLPTDNMDRVKRIWHLSPLRAAKVQASLRIRAVSPEPPLSLIQAVSQEEPSDRKSDPGDFWMAGHAQLNLVTTECSKTQIRLTGLICFNIIVFKTFTQFQNLSEEGMAPCRWKFNRIMLLSISKTQK